MSIFQKRGRESFSTPQTRGKTTPDPFLAAGGFVGEVGRQPALDLFDRTPLAAGITGDLVVPDSADGEVPRLRMREIEAADARGRDHRGMVGQGEAGRGGVEQVEQLELLTVIG